MDIEDLSKIIIGGIVGIILGVVLGVVVFRSPAPAGFAMYNTFSSPDIATISVATSTGVNVLSSNSGRKYASIDNEDGTNTVYCVFGATSTVAVSKGLKIEAGERYEITPNNLYTGQVSCIASNARVTVSTIEK